MTIDRAIDEAIHQFLADAGEALTDPARAKSCLFEIHAALAQHLGKVEDLLHQEGELDTVIVSARFREMKIGASDVQEGKVH